MGKKKADDKSVKIRISADLAGRLEALGPDWEDQVERILHTHLAGAPRGGKLASFIADTVGPLKDHPLAPHVEKAAKDIATKVAKDVATAAATAALAAWTAKMQPQDKPAEAPRPQRKPKPDTPPQA